MAKKGKQEYDDRMRRMAVDTLGKTFVEKGSVCERGRGGREVEGEVGVL